MYFRLFSSICLCSGLGLKKTHPTSEQSGVHYEDIGKFKRIVYKDPIVLVTYNLTHLEHIAQNALELENVIGKEKLDNFENTLDKIYKICRMKSRSYFLPYNSANLSEGQLVETFEKLSPEPEQILSELVDFVSKNYTDHHGIERMMLATSDLYPKYFKNFDNIKNYIRLQPEIHKLDKSNVYVEVMIYLPYSETVSLSRVKYVPRIHDKVVQVIEDQNVTHVAYNSENFIQIKDFEFIEDLIVFKEERLRNTCLRSETCLYKNSVNSFQAFTYLEGNKFYVLTPKQINYIYNCPGEEPEQGKLNSGIIEIQNQCSLITAQITIKNNNGDFQILQVYNEYLEWLDIEKNFGVPNYVFEIVIGVLSFLLFVIIALAICICVIWYCCPRRYGFLK